MIFYGKIWAQNSQIQQKKLTLPLAFPPQMCYNNHRGCFRPIIADAKEVKSQ